MTFKSLPTSVVASVMEQGVWYAPTVCGARPGAHPRAGGLRRRAQAIRARLKFARLIHRLYTFASENFPGKSAAGAVR
jgi:hypothetical protein